MRYRWHIDARYEGGPAFVFRDVYRASGGWMRRLGERTTATDVTMLLFGFHEPAPRSTMCAIEITVLLRAIRDMNGQRSVSANPLDPCPG